MRDDRERLLDIGEAIASIDSYATQGRDVYDRNPLVRIWVVHHVQIIGEAAAKLSPNLRARYPNIPWDDIISM